MSFSEPCLREGAQGLTPDEVLDKFGDNLSGCDFFCQRIVGRKACQYFFRFGTQADGDVTPRIVSNAPCEAELINTRLVETLRNAAMSEAQSRANESGDEATIYITSETGKISVHTVPRTAGNDVADRYTETHLTPRQTTPLKRYGVALHPEASESLTGYFG